MTDQRALKAARWAVLWESRDGLTSQEKNRDQRLAQHAGVGGDHGSGPQPPLARRSTCWASRRLSLRDRWRSARFRTLSRARQAGRRAQAGPCLRATGSAARCRPVSACPHCRAAGELAARQRRARAESQAPAQPKPVAGSTRGQGQRVRIQPIVCPPPVARPCQEPWRSRHRAAIRVSPAGRPLPSLPRTPQQDFPALLKGCREAGQQAAQFQGPEPQRRQPRRAVWEPPGPGLAPSKREASRRGPAVPEPSEPAL